MVLLILDCVVLVLGVAAIAYAGHNAWKFGHVKSHLAKAFTRNLIGETIAGVLTLSFGIGQITGTLPDMSLELQNLMRIVIMVVLLIPSVGLKRVVWEIEHGKQ